MSNLKQMRVARGMSQSQLANASGIKVRMLQNYEQGTNNIDGARIETLIDLSNALNCSIHEILSDELLQEKTKKARL